MLAPLAFVLAPQDASSPLGIARTLLAGSGYELRIENDFAGPGILVRGDRRVRANLKFVASYSSAPYDPVLQLAAEVDVPKERPQVSLAGFRRDDLPPGRYVAAPSLGRTVTIHGDVRLYGTATPQGVRAQLDGYFAAVESFVRTQGATWAFHAPADWRLGSLGDDLVLSAPDLPSVERLARSWGWTNAPARSRGELRTTLWINGIWVDVGDLFPVTPDSARFLSLSKFVYPVRRPQADAWVRAAPKGRRTVSPEVSGIAEERIPLPIRTGELRKRILAFVRAVRTMNPEGGRPPSGSR